MMVAQIGETMVDMKVASRAEQKVVEKVED